MMALADQYKGYDDITQPKHSSDKVKKARIVQKTNGKVPLSFLDKFLIVVTLMLCTLFAVSGITTMAKTFTVNQENIELQAQKSELEKSNKDLEDTISQLTMSEAVIEVANELGLSMNEDNVKVAE